VTKRKDLSRKGGSVLKRYLTLPFLLLLLVGAISSSYGQDGAFDFSDPWGNAAVGSGEIFSGPGIDLFNRMDTLIRHMDFEALQGENPFGFDEFFGDFLDRAGTAESERKSLLSPFSISQTEKAMAFKAGLLPGTGLGDVAVSSDGEVLTINVEKTVMNEESGDNYNQVDWSRESFTRITPLPGEVEPKEMVTSYEDGVLSVTFPKNQ